MNISNFFNLADGLSLSEIFWALSACSIVIGVIAGLTRLVNGVLEFRRLKAAEALRQKLSSSAGASAFSKEEVRDSLRNYIVPDCAQTDPSNQNDLRLVADVRESVMEAVDRFIAHGNEYRHLLILADSGMGKTTFCLNYFHRVLQRGKQCAVIPLGRPDVLRSIRNIEVKNDCVLILDALDEDPLALKDGEGRVKELMDAAGDFLAVIITCRSQFFANDASIPTRTGVSVVRPRRAGEAGEYRFSRLYLLPFSEDQIGRYLKASFPLWSWRGIARRGEARRLIRDIPELSVRPMLLALVPELVKSGRSVSGLFELYGFMVNSWLEREKNWISPESLLTISKELALYMYNAKFLQIPDRVSVGTLHEFASRLGIDEKDWKHLTSRSLLNRDSEGNFKFSHRSIMEYLIVLSAIEGNDGCFEYAWTDMMRDMFVSWGHTPDARAKAERAHEVLSLDLEKLGLAPLASPLAEPATIRIGELRASLERGQRSGRRIPHEWRPQSLRVSKSGHAYIVRDLQFDLEWTVPDPRALPETSLLSMYRSQAELVGGDAARLPSTEEFLSFVDADALVDATVLEASVFYWLGDQFGRGKYLVASLGPEALSHDALKLVGKAEGRSKYGGVWIYEVANSARLFGGKIKDVSARVLAVRPGDSGEYRKLAMMSPEAYALHMKKMGEQLQMLADIVGTRNEHAEGSEAIKAKPSPRSPRRRP